MKKMYFVLTGMIVFFLMASTEKSQAAGRSTNMILSGRFDNTVSAPFGDTLLLPMTLLEFTARQSGHNCSLSWKSVREEYSPGYNVERSTDGSKFTEVGKTGAGKELGLQQFEFTDYGAANLGSKFIFYRLRQLNAEGKSEYTHVLVITVAFNGSFVNMFPNPVIDNANVLVHVSTQEKLGWILSDQSGRSLRSGRCDVSPGASRMNIDLKMLPAGIYYLQLKSATINSQLKVMKL